MYRRLRSAERTSTLDKTILLSCYGEHGVRLTNEIQSHQVELILYTLLLSGWEMLKEQNKEKHFRRANGELVDYWPLDLIGVSSLEYSARWGMRWLDYKLVEEVCQIFLTSESMQEEKEPDLATHRAWLDWQEAVAAFVEKLVPGTSALQVVHEMETLLHLLNRPGKFEAHLPKPEQIEQFYKRLTEAMQEMPGVIRQLQLSLPDERNELYRTLKANWQTLLNHTTRLPAALLFPPEQSDVRPFLFNPHGLLPRAQRSVRLLGRALSEIQRQAENLPDLTMSREWVKLAAHRLPLQARAARTRQKRSIYARHQQELLTQIRADLELVRAFLRAQVEQTLLGEAGLISHEGHLSRYMQGLCELVKMVQGAVVAARQMHENARNRLSMSLSLMQPGSWKGDVQLNPRCRADLLDWDAMKGACERLKEDLHRPARPLALLGYCLLSLLSGTDPACLLPDLVDPAPPETEPPFGRAQQSGAERQEARDRQKKLLRLQEAGTLIVTMALCSRQVSVSVKAYQELVKDYLHQVSQLALDFTSLTRILEQIQTRGLPAGTNQHGVDSPEGLPLGRENTFEVLLAGWMNNEYITLHEYADILGRNELFARMLSADASPAAIFTDLNERNIMLGNIAALYRTTKNAYLLVPGDNGPRFEQEIASDTMHMRDYLQVLSFPDIEKMIYLKVDHIAYPQDELLLSSEKEGA
jgi:hypothetical protein